MHKLLTLTLALALLQPVFAQEETEKELHARLETLAKNYKPSFPEAGEFDATGWLSNEDFELIGSKDAKKGGQLLMAWQAYPPTLRTDGPNSNLVQLSEIRGMVYESLIGTHPDSLAPIPGLATHWQRESVAKGGKVVAEIYRFRINPKARWADGSEVTADDVVATWWHQTQKDRKDPSNVLVYSQFEEPKALSKYVVEVQTKKVNWRLFLYFGGMAIYPAKYIKIKGEDYLKAYQWKLMMGSGPYHVADYEKDLVKDESFVLTRRDDYWGEQERSNFGANNFDRLKWVVVKDRNLQFQKIQSFELDYYVVGKAQRWAEECEFPAVKKGHVLKRKIYNDQPQGMGGFCFNMRKAPFDDLRVRKAFAHLFNREKLIKQLFFNQYGYKDNYFGGSWGNPTNPKVRYNPKLAAELLKAAGYTERNAEGILVKGGKPFEITLEYGWDTYTRIFLVIQQDLKQAGIKMNLKLLDGRTVYKKVNERQFTIAFLSYSGLLYPNPRTSWHSSLADQVQNNNVPGFKNERVDRLLERYDNLLGVDATTWKKRQLVIRMIDKIIFNEYPYALSWGSSFTRILYQNKFGHPETYFTRIGSSAGIMSLWWIDKEKEAKLAAARKDGTQLDRGETVARPWDRSGEEEDAGDAEK